MSVRYSVVATLRDSQVLVEYVDWLRYGHVQSVVEGGAESAEVNILESDDGSVIVESTYIFPSRDVLQAYFDGPAIPLREEGKRLFVDTAKVTFSRRIGEIVFRC